MRGDHELNRLVLRPRVLLYEARDAHAFLCEDLADRGQHAGTIVNTNAVVGARHDLSHRYDANPVVEAERRPALHTAADRASEIDEVADHSGCGGTATGALPDEQDLPDQVAFHKHRVLGAFDTGQRMLEWDHGRMHPGFHPTWMPLGVRDELDRITQLACVTEVDRLDALDAFSKDLVGTDLDLVGDRGEDRQLVSGVIAADVVGGICLR